MSSLVLVPGLHAFKEPIAVCGRDLRVASQGLKLGARPDGGPGTPHVESPVHAALVDLGEVAGHAGVGLGVSHGSRWLDVSCSTCGPLVPWPSQAAGGYRPNS